MPVLKYPLRTLTPAEQTALVAVLRRAGRVRKIGFAIGVLLLVGVVGGVAWVTPLLFKYESDSPAMVLALSGLTVAALAWYLLSVRTHVFASAEETVRGAKRLAGIEGSFASTDVPLDIDGISSSVTVLAMAGRRVAVPKHWPALPPSGAALLFVADHTVSRGVLPPPPPKVVEIVGWRSLDADLRTGVVTAAGLRYRLKPRRAADGEPSARPLSP